MMRLMIRTMTATTSRRWDQTAANMADKAKKPETDQDDNYSPEHRFLWVELNFRQQTYSEVHLLAKLFPKSSRKVRYGGRFVIKNVAAALCAMLRAQNGSDDYGFVVVVVVSVSFFS